MPPELLHHVVALLMECLSLLTEATAASHPAPVDPRMTYIGSEPHKLDARLHARRRIAEWLEGHGCVDFGVKVPDYRHERYDLRWKLTTVHLLIYRRTRERRANARAMWGAPVARIPLLDLLDYFAWLHQPGARRPAIAWPHPTELEEKAAEIAQVASVMRAARETGPGFRMKIAWDK